MKRKKHCAAIIVYLAMAFVLLPPERAEAAEANVTFGSESYVRRVGENFNIGVYIRSEEAVGDYDVTLHYDENYLEYVSGAQSGGGGSVTLSGTDDGGYVKTLVRFRAKAAGSTSVSITGAVFSALGEGGLENEDGTGAEGENGDGNEIQEGVTLPAPAPVTLRSEQAVYLEGILADGEPLLDFEPEQTAYAFTVPYETEFLDIEAQGAEAQISDTRLAEGENKITLSVAGSGGVVTIYTLDVTREEAPPPEPEESESAVSELEIPQPVYEQEEGGGIFFSIFKQKIVLIPCIGVVLIVFLASFIYTWFEYKREQEREKRKKRLKQPSSRANVIDMDLVQTEAAKADARRTRSKEQKEPIVSVQNVSMEFKIATQNVSGIKEWVIEKVKGRLSYRTLKALSHVSFNVYPGEVVGIIGTNGSGKSTLLKIISGALKPTSGKVIADRSKIQLLTLGTGFDMELTARENIYLNGAIIGYSREFIDEHYDDIVEFSELADFMEEKVKNFSSGMVSRLAFAIATAGEAAEILILDEVLSVGDEFFRKKSLARIKEMIHGGSTVLMVSHNMNTITSNCSRAVWIEKGRLRMEGKAKRVCMAYQGMGKE